MQIALSVMVQVLINVQDVRRLIFFKKETVLLLARMFMILDFTFKTITIEYAKSPGIDMTLSVL